MEQLETELQALRDKLEAGHDVGVKGSDGEDLKRVQQELKEAQLARKAAQMELQVAATREERQVKANHPFSLLNPNPDPNLEPNLEGPRV